MGNWECGLGWRVMITLLAYGFLNLATHQNHLGSFNKFLLSGSHLQTHCCNWWGMQPGVHTRICKGWLAIIMDSKVSELQLQLILPQPQTDPILPGKKSIVMRRRETQPVRNVFILLAELKWSRRELSGKTVLCAVRKVSALVSSQIKLIDTEGPPACATS